MHMQTMPRPLCLSDVTADDVPRIAVGCMLFDLAYWATERLEPTAKEPPLPVNDGTLLYVVEQPHRVIRCVSDLLHRPWFKVKDRNWLLTSRRRRLVMRYFLSMVERGEISLRHRGGGHDYPRPGIVFDVPLPWLRDVRLPPGTCRTDSTALASACSFATRAVGRSLSGRVRYGDFITPARGMMRGYVYKGLPVVSRELEDVLSTRSTHTERHAGRVLRHPLSDELPVNVLVGLLDLEARPRLWLLVDVVLLKSMEAAGVAVVVAGCHQSAMLQ